MFTIQTIKAAIDRLTEKPKSLSIVEVQTLTHRRSLRESDREDLCDLLFSDENASES